MMRGRVFSLLVCFVLCVISPRSANAAPALNLWMEFNSGTNAVEVHRENIDFGLGALAYNMTFDGESLDLSREYSDYGWFANDGLWDSSTPGDGVSARGFFTSIRFDTARSPANSEFSPGTGVVESITIWDLTPRWIYFDILNNTSSPVVATNGAGVNIVQLPGGSAPIVIPDPDGQGHTLAVYIPEPATMLLLSLGGIFVLRKRKK